MDALCRLDEVRVRSRLEIHEEAELAFCLFAAGEDALTPGDVNRNRLCQIHVLVRGDDRGDLFWMKIGRAGHDYTVYV